MEGFFFIVGFFVVIFVGIAFTNSLVDESGASDPSDDDSSLDQTYN